MKKYLITILLLTFSLNTNANVNQTYKLNDEAILCIDAGLAELIRTAVLTKEERFATELMMLTLNESLCFLGQNIKTVSITKTEGEFSQVEIIGIKNIKLWVANVFLIKAN